MPFRKRRLRSFHGGGPELTEHQHRVLAFGYDLLEPITTGNPDPEAAERRLRAMRTAWAAHRTQIMAAETKPGLRPWSFFRFDLGVEKPPQRPLDQIDVLVAHNLIDVGEALSIERNYPMLAPGMEEFGANLSSVERIKAQQISDPTVRRWAGQFSIAARWHRWRGRPEIAAQFDKRGLACEAWVASQNTGERE